jgi:hypothetical protein
VALSLVRLSPPRTQLELQRMLAAGAALADLAAGS